MKRVLKWILGILLVALIGLFAVGYTPDTDPAAMRLKYGGQAARFMDVGGGVTVHYRDQGNPQGPVLVLLHGSNASLHTWEPWVARLQGKYRIISLDQIGHGLTGPNPTGQYDSAAFVGTLDALMTKLGITRFALAGNSMGGYVAWEYALAHPDKLTHLVLVAAAGAPEDPNREIPIGFKIARHPLLSKLGLVITPRGMFERSLHGSVSNHAVITDAVIDRYWELNRMPGNRAATGARFAQYGTRQNNTARLGEIKVPTLILWGAEDKLLPVSGAGWFAAQIPGSVRIVYPKIGHVPQEEAADRSAADADAFLSKPFPSPGSATSIPAPRP